MSADFEQKNDMDFEEDIRLEEEYLEQLRDIFYSDETDIDAARKYASELLEYYFYNDERNVLLKIVRELKYVYSAFKNDQIIAENLAVCLSMWGVDKSIPVLLTFKNDLSSLKTLFPDSEDIAEAYSDIIIYMARSEREITVLNTYLNELLKFKNEFIGKRYPDMGDGIPGSGLYDFNENGERNVSYLLEVYFSEDGTITDIEILSSEGCEWEGIKNSSYSDCYPNYDFLSEQLKNKLDNTK